MKLQYLDSLCIRFLSLSITILRFVHTITCMSMSFLFLLSEQQPQNCSLLYELAHEFLFCLPVGGFQFGTLCCLLIQQTCLFFVLFLKFICVCVDARGSQKMVLDSPLIWGYGYLWAIWYESWKLISGCLKKQRGSRRSTLGVIHSLEAAHIIFLDKYSLTETWGL